MSRIVSRAAIISAGVAAMAAALDARQEMPSASPVFTQWTTLCDGVEHTTSIALGDLDADGDLDVVYGNGRHLPERDWIWSNNGRGVLYGKRPLGLDADPTYAIALGDIDGNGTPDLIVANDTGHPSLAYRNDGHGNFTLLGPLGRARQPRRAAAAGDFDGDGDLDAVLVGLGQDHIYLNDGTGRRWIERELGTREGGAPGRATGVAVGDLDGDRDLDIVVPGRYEAPSVVYLNDGKAGFDQQRQFGSPADDMTSVALADIDGNGTLDILTGNWRQPHHVYARNGRGEFTRQGTFGAGHEQTWSVAIADMDLDGDQDVVVGNADIAYWGIDLDGNGLDPRDRYGNEQTGAPGRLYLNDGRGQLQAGSSFGIGNDNTRPVALGDIDGDGDTDIVVGNDCQPNHVFFNSLRGLRGERLP